MAQLAGYTSTQNRDVIIPDRTGTHYSLRINSHPIVVQQGTTAVATMNLKDNNSRPIKLMGKTVLAHLTDRRSNDKLTNVKTVITNYESGTVDITITSEITAALSPTFYKLVLTLVDDQGIGTPIYASQDYASTSFDVSVIKAPISHIAPSQVASNFVLSNEKYTSFRLASSAQNPTSYGLHMMSIKMTDFTGTVGIQATTVITPDDSAWFDITQPYTLANLEYENYTGNDAYSFDGWFTWIRFVIQTDDQTLPTITYRS